MEPHWTTYASLAVGALGWVLAAVTYLRGNGIKRINLKHDVSVEYESLSGATAGLLTLLDDARASRHAVSAARGRLKSGAIQKFDETYEDDRREAQQLIEEVHAISAVRLDKLRYGALMESFTEIRRLQHRIRLLADKYRAELRKDDEDRNHLREDRRAIEAAKITRSEPYS